MDFIARMEDVTIHAAALKAIEWFSLDAEVMRTNAKETPKAHRETPTTNTGTDKKTASNPATPAPEANEANKPLGFQLEKLDRAHPYLGERGLTQETVMEFGIGYCAKGMMAGRIAIPISNVEGKVVAYVGRIPGEPSGDVAKYKLPAGFRKSLELFNIDRACKEPADKPLVIVEGFFDCLKLHQSGCRKVVALMGSTMSEAQEELIRKDASHWSRILLMLDEDEAGRAGREDIAPRLAKFAFVKIHVFPSEDMQPDRITIDDLNTLFAGAQ